MALWFLLLFSLSVCSKIFGSKCIKKEYDAHSTDQWCADYYNVQGLCPRHCKLVDAQPDMNSSDKNKSNLENAKQFFNAMEGGKGWVVCKKFCTPKATFRTQASLEIGNFVENYTEFMNMTHKLMPNLYWTDLANAYDEETNTALISGTLHGKHTNTPEGAPMPPPTFKSVTSDYVYRIHFNEAGKIDGVIKIWNFEFAAKQLGWNKPA